MSLDGRELSIDGSRVSLQIENSLTAATLTRGMDVASSLSFTISDPMAAFLLSGALIRQGNPSSTQEELDQAAWSRFAAGRLNLDGVSFRLAGSSGNYDIAPGTNTLTLEDEVATCMRLATKAVKVSRGDRTRAEFEGLLLKTALARESVPFTKTLADRFYSPQAGQRQATTRPTDPERQKGIHHLSGLTVKGAPMDSEQRTNAEIILRLCDDLKAGERATLAAIDAAIGESRIINVEGGLGTSEGVYQVEASTALGKVPTAIVDPRTGQVHGGGTITGRLAPGKLNPRDIKACAYVFLLSGFAGSGGAIQYASQHPNAQIYEIAQAVQGSGAGAASKGQSNYGPWVKEAQAILDAWGGVGTLHTIREQVEFRAGGKKNGRNQNYWDDSAELAADVVWRRFADLNRLWFVDDDWLLNEQKPLFVIDGKNGLAGLAAAGLIGGPVYDMDIGLPVAEITISAYSTRWGAAPGGVVQFQNLGGLNGKWLIWQSVTDLLATPETVQLTLQRPAPAKKEPSTTKTVQSTETKPTKGTIRAALIAAANKAYAERGRYVWQETRPMPPTLFPKATIQLVVVDCSAFVTLLYRAAKANDPNGMGYANALKIGNTTYLRANGTKTNDPHPGDLVFYSNPDHVAMYMGDNEVIEIGGKAGVSILQDKDANGRKGYRDPQKIGYYTYNLGDGS